MIDYFICPFDMLFHIIFSVGDRPESSHFSIAVLIIGNCFGNNSSDESNAFFKPMYKYIFKKKNVESFKIKMSESLSNYKHNKY